MASPKKKTDGDGGDTNAEQVETADETTPVDPRIAELEAQVASLREELVAANDRRIHDLAEMRERFDQAWQERMGVPAPVPPAMRGTVRRFAASLIRCHDNTGAKLTLSAGDPIPDEADLTGVSRDAIEER